MDICMYTEDVTSCTIVCGMILLKISMTTMNPQLVINHCEKDMDIENLSLALCGNNVRTLLTLMQEKKDDINTLRKYGVKFYEQIFLTILFDKVLATGCDYFVQMWSSREMHG